MITFTASDIQRVAISSIGALILSTACIASAIGPAKAAERNAPLTVDDWQQRVSRQLDTSMRTPVTAGHELEEGLVTIHAYFDANGSFDKASIARSSKSAAIDGAALRTARTLAYPALPAGLRGKPQTITLMLYYGVAADARNADEQRQTVERLAHATHRHQNIQTAALPSG